MELQEWQKLSEEQKYRYSEELAAHLPQSVIFKGLRFYPDGGPEREHLSYAMSRNTQRASMREYDKR